MKILVFYFAITFLIDSCDPTFIYQTDGSETKFVKFSCGKVSIETTSSFGPEVIMRLRFSLDKKVQLNFDSLKIQCENKPLPFEVANGNMDKISVEIVGDTIFSLIVPLKSLANDTLDVTVKGFMICEGKSVYNDKLTIVLRPSKVRSLKK